MCRKRALKGSLLALEVITMLNRSVKVSEEGEPPDNPSWRPGRAVGVCGAPDCPRGPEVEKNKPPGELTTHRLERGELRQNPWASYRGKVEQLRLCKLDRWETAEMDGLKVPGNWEIGSGQSTGEGLSLNSIG